jgi:antitoxin ParD1/3/4
MVYHRALSLGMSTLNPIPVPFLGSGIAQINLTAGGIQDGVMEMNMTPKGGGHVGPRLAFITGISYGRKYSYQPARGLAMPNVEKISIALPPEMVAVVRQAVETGEYASSSEVVRDALRDWTQKRSLRQQGIDELRQVWRQAMEDKTPGVPVKEVLDRLERKYQKLAGAGK